MDSNIRSLPTFEAAGVRGSHVVTDQSFNGYGGDTTCLFLTSSTGGHLIVDAGSGLFRLNPLLSAENDIDLFISHTHVDHIQGLFFFDAFYKRNRAITIYCSSATQQALQQFFAPPFFPVRLEEVPSPPRWRLFPSETGAVSFRTPSFTCEAIPLPHPGGAYALLTTDTATGQSLLIANDFEIQPDEPFEDQPGLAPLLNCLLKHGPVDAAVVDAMFDPDEMAKHKGWGHSDYKTAAIFAKHIHARQIYLSHHSPKASDDILDARQKAISSNNVSILRQQHPFPWRTPL